MKISVTYTNFDKDIESVSIDFGNSVTQVITTVEKDVVTGVDDQGQDIIETVEMLKFTTGDGITNYESEMESVSLTEYLTLLTRLSRQIKS